MQKKLIKKPSQPIGKPKVHSRILHSKMPEKELSTRTWQLSHRIGPVNSHPTPMNLRIPRLLMMIKWHWSHKRSLLLTPLIKHGMREINHRMEQLETINWNRISNRLKINMIKRKLRSITLRTLMSQRRRGSKKLVKKPPQPQLLIFSGVELKKMLKELKEKLATLPKFQLLKVLLRSLERLIRLLILLTRTCQQLKTLLPQTLILKTLLIL